MIKLLAAAALLCAGARAERAPEKGCKWTVSRSEELGLSVRHQRCDFGFRTIDFAFAKGKTSLFEVIRDSGAKKDGLYPVITVFRKKEGEKIEDAIKRAAAKGLSFKKKRHCRVVYKRLERDVLGRLTFAYTPDEGYAAQIAKDAGTDIPEPACGDFGEMPDSLVYWVYHPDESQTRFAFVSAGQDVPLFDEESLRFLP